MHHPPLMHVLHCGGQLQHDVVGLTLVERVLLPDAVQQLTALEQLHHNVHMELRESGRRERGGKRVESGRGRGGGVEWEGVEWEGGSGRRWGVLVEYQISGRCLRADTDMWEKLTCP